MINGSRSSLKQEHQGLHSRAAVEEELGNPVLAHQPAGVTSVQAKGTYHLFPSHRSYLLLLDCAYLAIAPTASSINLSGSDVNSGKGSPSCSQEVRGYVPYIRTHETMSHLELIISLCSIQKQTLSGSERISHEPAVTCSFGVRRPVPTARTCRDMFVRCWKVRPNCTNLS
uniref:Uncharacterized protein n=1 Tax=Timema genevievae TaxID=629358 RepID=A0A7R9K244_TIMGE|nr:unnamed protein product [Timema genevievae]